MAACTDFGLASAFLKALSEQHGGEYEAMAAEMSRRAQKAERRRAMGPKCKPGREHHE